MCFISAPPQLQVLGQLGQLLHEQLQLFLALLAGDLLNFLVAKCLVDPYDTGLGGPSVFVIIGRAAHDNCWVHLLRWEVLTRQLLQLSRVELLFLGQEEFDDFESLA